MNDTQTPPAEGADAPPADGSAEPLPPRPPGTQRPPLRRDSANSMLGGVAAGLGRTLGIDVNLVRVAVAVLAVFGGAGVVLYALAWLLIPDDHGEVIVQRWLPDSADDFGPLGVILLIVAAIVALGALGGEGLFLPAVLVGVGLWLLLRTSSPPPARPDPHSQATGPQATDPRVTGSGATGPHAAGSAGSVPPVGTAAGSSGLVGDSPPDATAPSATAPAGNDPTWVGPPSVPSPPAGPVSPVVKARREPPFLTPLLLALTLIVVGGAVILDRADVLTVSFGGVVAAALIVVGGGLIVSAWFGRARGMIPIGLLLSLMLLPAAVFDFPLWSGVGERRVEVDEVSALRSEYHHGIGELVVDLSALDLDGDTVEVEAGISIGSLRVIVPDDVDVTVAGEVEAGELRLLDERRDGLDRRLTATHNEPAERGSIELDVQVGFGEARVVRR